MIRRLSCSTLLMLAACATPAQRIVTALTGYGVPPAEARCMGDRLQSRLSLSELRRLEALAKLAPPSGSKVNLDALARALDNPEDRGVAAEVVKAGFACLV